MSRKDRRKIVGSIESPPLSPLPASPEPLKGFWRWALPFLLLVYLVLALTHAWLAPTGLTGLQNAPDEAAHVTYIQSVRAGHLPTRSDPQPGIAEARPSYEWHQPPLYYVLASPWLPLGERALRLASILCGLISILLIYRFARRIFPEDPGMAILAAGLAALIPSHIAITSTVNNDPLLEVCFSGFLTLLAASLKEGFTTGRAIGTGVLLGLALLTKATAILLFPILALAILLLWRGGTTPRRLWIGLSCILGIAFLLSGWWLVRNEQLYHEVLPLKAFEQSFSGTAQAADFVQRIGWGDYLRMVGQMSFQSFWAVYGTNYSATKLNGWPLFLPDQLYWLLGGVTLAIMLGLIRLHFRAKTEMSETQRFSLWLLFATVLLVVGAFLSFILHYFQTQGRYVYPAMLPICIVFSLGWRTALPPRYVELGSSALLGFLCILSIAFLLYVHP